MTIIVCYPVEPVWGYNGLGRGPKGNSHFLLLQKFWSLGKIIPIRMGSKMLNWYINGALYGRIWGRPSKAGCVKMNVNSSSSSGEHQQIPVCFFCPKVLRYFFVCVSLLGYDTNVVNL